MVLFKLGAGKTIVSLLYVAVTTERLFLIARVLVLVAYLQDSEVFESEV